MEASYFLFNHSSDDTLDLLKGFLPDIEQQLRLQIEPQLLQQFALRTEQQLKKIEDQAECQYNEAEETLQNQFQQLKQQKQKSLHVEIDLLQQKLNEHEQKRFLTAQEKFIQENLDNRILSHEKLQEVADELQNQLGQALLQKYEAVREKKTKEARIQIEKREQRERNELDRTIQEEIYSKSGLAELRQEVKQFKIQLASLKSKYNIKINGINKEIQQLNKKIKQSDIHNSELIIAQLEAELESLKSKPVQKELSFQNQNQIPPKHEEKSPDYLSQHKVFSVINQPFLHYPEAQYYQQDIDLSSQDSIISNSERQNDESEPSIPMPPDNNRMLTHLLCHEQQQQSQAPNDEQVYLEVPKQPLLRFNVAKMLREQWQQDDMDRYLYGQSQKQNKRDASNTIPTSNFTTLYKQHLDQLNRNNQSKTRKLSEKAKQQLLLNLSSYRQKKQQYAINA